MSAHDIFMWLDGFFHSWQQRKPATPTGWQREKPMEQDTGGYHLPDIIGDIAGGPEWRGARGTWTKVYRYKHQQEQVHRRGDTPIPATATNGDTDGIRRVSAEPPLVRKIAHTGRLEPIKPWELDTVPPLPGLPHWMVAQTPIGAGDLPVQRLKPDVPAPEPLQESANYAALDGMLATMRPLPAFMGFSADLDVVPDLPTVKPTSEQVDAWLNSAPQYEPPVLAELPQDALAVADRVAGVHPMIEVTPEDCVPDLEDEDEPTRGLETPGLYQMSLLARRKESEK